MTNVMILTLKSSTFLFYVVTYHFHLLIVCISPSWFERQEQNYDFANSKVVIMTFFTIMNYHWPICWMICFIQSVRLSYPYWLWWRVIPYTKLRLRVQNGCDRSTGDAYSFVTPDPASTFVGGLFCPTLKFAIVFGIMLTFYTLLASLFCRQQTSKCKLYFKRNYGFLLIFLISNQFNSNKIKAIWN
jgi:hypothetical protein